MMKITGYLRKYWGILPVIAFFAWFLLILPSPLFRDPVSTVLLDRNGDLLGARLATDGQWRFPETEKVPEKFAISLVQYEDRYFRWHPGINPVAIARAAYLNLKNQKIVSGGSTITMQVIRLARKNKPRNYWQKITEMFLALRLEMTYSKSSVLRLYASNAPFGGNVVGIDAAAWRYFGIPADQLSWAESATLAVLPNSPGMIYPGRNPAELLRKRNELLDLLNRRGFIDSRTCELAKSEQLPSRPYPLPQKAGQLLDRVISESQSGRIVKTSIDGNLQERVTGILVRHAISLNANQIFNAAAVIVDVNTGNAMIYTGNLPPSGRQIHGNDVDIINSPRSTGSILKPFLYAAMLNDGLLLPNTLVPDIPTQIAGFVPQNYNLTYDGAVPAKKALSRSLNIPAVKMLQTYGYDQFYSLLRKIGMSTLEKPADHYGLSIILGGAEATLWDLAGIYSSMARTLNRYNSTGGKYSGNDFHPAGYLPAGHESPPDLTPTHSYFDAASIWLTFEAMVEVSRPDEEEQWQRFASSEKIAWKTGTSFGNRDAWAIGVTPQFVVAVWAGNASGEGRPGLSGISAAAPVLFDIFSILPRTTWFDEPDSAMARIPVCRYSGYRASTVCDLVDTMAVQKSGLNTRPCPYHVLVHLDRSGQYQVNTSCEAPENIVTVPWFVLPPAMEWYFRNKNPFYKQLPPFRPGCTPAVQGRSMEMIYPKNNSVLYIPVDLDGTPGSTIFKLAHRNPAMTVYWHLDDRYLGSTLQSHQMTISPSKGTHTLTLVDQNGETLVVRFTILRK